jgi:hypothetical protein
VSLSKQDEMKHRYPAHSEVIGPEQDVLIISKGKEYVAYPELVYITCENGWVDLQNWR